MIYSCNSDDTQEVQQETKLCGATDLGIDEMSMYSAINFEIETETEMVFSPTLSSKWNWRVIDGVIEVFGTTTTYYPGALPDSYYYEQMYFKKNEDNCIEFLRRVSFENQDGVWYDEVLDMHISITYWENPGDEFYVQEYVEENRLVGKIKKSRNGDIDFWIEFNEENHNPDFYGHENVVHPQ